MSETATAKHQVANPDVDQMQSSGQLQLIRVTRVHCLLLPVLNRHKMLISDPGTRRVSFGDTQPVSGCHRKLQLWIRQRTNALDFYFFQNI